MTFKPQTIHHRIAAAQLAVGFLDRVEMDNKHNDHNTSPYGGLLSRTREGELEKLRGSANAHLVKLMSRMGEDERPSMQTLAADLAPVVVQCARRAGEERPFIAQIIESGHGAAFALPHVYGIDREFREALMAELPEAYDAPESLWFGSFKDDPDTELLGHAAEAVIRKTQSAATEVEIARSVTLLLNYAGMSGSIYYSYLVMANPLSELVDCVEELNRMALILPGENPLRELATRIAVAATMPHVMDDGALINMAIGTLDPTGFDGEYSAQLEDRFINQLEMACANALGLKDGEWTTAAQIRAAEDLDHYA